MMDNNSCFYLLDSIIIHTIRHQLKENIMINLPSSRVVKTNARKKESRWQKLAEENCSSHSVLS